jgi:CPA2 family monovalent cation:H+ antiporter-2
MPPVDSSYFTEVFLILFVSVALGLFSSHLKQSLIMGYILAGVLLGPHCLKLIRDVAEIKQIAELGLVFLMFTIGLEFSYRKIRTMQRIVLGAGFFQVLATITMGAALSLALGFSVTTAIFIGCVMSLSSTAIVSKELATHKELDSPQGRISIGIAIFQDLAVIPMMIFLPTLHSGSGQWGIELFHALWKTAVFLSAAFLTGRFIFPHILSFTVKLGGKELLTLATLMLVLGTATISQAFGLSMVLGAFIAGVMLSETEFNFEIHHLVAPFRELFMSLFFVSIGLLLNVAFLFSHFWQVALFATAILIANTAVCSLVVMIFGYPLRVAIFSALILAEIGEFSFVLIQMGASHRLVSEEVYQLLLSLTAATLFVTPFIYKLGTRLSLLMDKVQWFKGHWKKEDETSDALRSLKDHVIVCGFGPVGQNLGYHLKKQGVPFVITEMNVETVKKFSKKGLPIYFGDAASSHILEKLGAPRAKAIAVTMLDPDGLGSIIAEAKKLNPNICILARARYMSEIGELLAQGVTDVVSEELETSKVFAEKLIALA